MTNLKICFAGTPVFAQAILSFLIRQSCNITAVYTQADKPAGRGRQLTASPVKMLATAHNYPIYQPKTLRTETAIAAFKALAPDVLVVVAYGLILPKAILDIPRYGCLNVHASLLPRWRGAAPIQRAVEAGDRETGITIMQMDEGLDTGDMLVKHTCSIEPSETSQTLHDKMIPIAQTALWEALSALKQGSPLKPQAQPELGVTYAHKIQKSEAELDWNTPADLLEQKIRAFIPWPVAFSLFSGSSPIRIWSARVSAHTHNTTPGKVVSLSSDGLLVAAGNGSCLNIQILQLPGKKPQPITALLHNKTLRAQLNIL
jgi:methionyl-tRNA formyltransferase